MSVDALGRYGVSVEDVSNGMLRLIGVTEFAAALGLILPAATDIAVWLTPLAACGIALIMVLAMGLHARREEPTAIATNVVLLVLAVLVAWALRPVLVLKPQTSRTP
jgi:predicted Na+-dependent transporter